MSGLRECWFNVYPSGFNGLMHTDRESARIAGERHHDQILLGSETAAYRVHVKLKSPSELSPPDVSAPAGADASPVSAGAVPFLKRSSKTTLRVAASSAIQEPSHV